MTCFIAHREPLTHFHMQNFSTMFTSLIQLQQSMNRMYVRCTVWIYIKAYGFIKGMDGNVYFVHKTQLKNRSHLHPGTEVSFIPMWQENKKDNSTKPLVTATNVCIRRDVICKLCRGEAHYSTHCPMHDVYRGSVQRQKWDKERRQKCRIRKERKQQIAPGANAMNYRQAVNTESKDQERIR